MAAPEIRCSLIVLNYQGEQVIEACLDSLLAAKAEHDELIVVDNGSSDRSLQILDKYRDRLRLLALRENTFIFGLNRGLEVACGRYVGFLNNDMVVEPSFVDGAIAALESEGDDVFAACPRILQPDGKEQGSRTAGYWKRGIIFYEPLPHREQITDCFFAVGGQSIFRAQALAEIGSIDPLLWPMYHEDVELSYRAWKRGWRVVYAPGAVAYHVGGHTSSRTFSQTQLRSFVRQNEFLTVWKNVTDTRLLLSHLALVLPRIAVAVAKRDWGTVVGFVSAVRRLPRALRARAAAKAHHRLTDAEVLRRIGRIR